MPRLSAAPLTDDQIEYDDLVVHRTWRVYEPGKPNEVRYLMYQLSQRDVGTDVYVSFYKAVRFLRVTRVPRYLRQVNTSASGTIFAHQRKLLAGLREQQVLFVNLVAKSPRLPLIFAYGVQAVGATIEEAQLLADESHAVLQTLLDGVYQQLEYIPLGVEEAELLVRYQSEWRNLAMARGKPKPLGDDGGVDSWLDGNRTDVENTQNMLESFIRGMGERSFLMTMVTVPVSPVELSTAWKNLARKLSDVRSEQSGTRGFSAGFALPLGLGSGMGSSSGVSHSAGSTVGDGTSGTIGHTDSYGTTAGINEATSQNVTVAEGVSNSISATEGVSSSVTQGTAQTDSLSQATSFSESASQGTSMSEALSQTTSAGQALSATQGQTLGVSQNVSQGVNSAQSLGQSVTGTQSWNSSISDQINGTISQANNFSRTFSQAVSQGFSLTDTNGDGIADSISSGRSTAAGNQFGLGIPQLGSGGLGLTDTNSTSGSFSRNASDSNAAGTTLSGTGSNGTSTGSSLSSSMSRGLGISDSVGGSNAVGVNATNSVGSSASVGSGVSQSTSNALGQSVTSAQSLGRSLGIGENFGRVVGVGESIGRAQGITQSMATSDGVSASNTVTAGTNQTQSVGAGVTSGRSLSMSNTQSDSVAQALMANRAFSDTYVNALSRNVQQTSTLGVVPNLGMSMSRNTYDEGKRVIGDLIEAQMNRYLEGVEAGAYFYQLYLVCEDPATLAGAAGLLKGSFWGPGNDRHRLPQPFHVITEFTDDERERLLQHASAFTSYRRVERNMDLIEPYVYSTYMTPSEGAAMTHPPAAEALGLLAVHDSMPVFAMPYDRADRDVYIGHLINGERARVSNQRWGFDLNEVTHTLVAGTTGSGKTTMLRRLIFEAVQARREIIDLDLTGGGAHKRDVPAGALILDWARSFRGLAAVLPPDRFRLYSVSRPEVGRLRFNPLAVPHEEMNPIEWANAVADLFMVAFGLGEFARSIFYEQVAELYAANRLQPYILRPAVYDEDGTLLRPAIELPAVDRATLPAGAVIIDPAGHEVANVHSCPALSRLVSLGHVAVLVAAQIERAATPQGAALQGRAMQDRLQTVWRRIMAFAPGGALAAMFQADERLDEPFNARVTDLINPEKGLVTIIEADGLDLMHRKFVLGSLVQAVFRYGQYVGEGVFDQNGKGPGTFIVLEEAHELFGSQGDGEDRDSAATRVAIWEGTFRRARQLGLKLVAAVQNPADVPDAILGNVGTVVSHQLASESDKRTIGSLFNWVQGVGQHYREHRYLGEMAVGHCIVRMKAKDHFLQSAPVHIAVDPPDLPKVTDAQLAALAARYA